MNYNLLEGIGLGMDLSYVLIAMMVVIIVLLVLLIVTMVKLGKISKKYQKFMTGKSAKSLEKEIMMLFDDNAEMKESIETNRKDIKILYKKFQKAFQKVGLVKYDAFNQMGGSLSFSLALLDENDTGFIINSVHSSEGCYSYSKEIHHGVCDIDLSAEESKALDMAVSGKSK